MPNDLQSIVTAAKQDAVARGAPAQAITVQSAQRVTWRDGSLGCPEPQMQYTQALVPGWRVILRVGDATYDYHATANGHLILCPRERATDPSRTSRPETKKKPRGISPGAWVSKSTALLVRAY